MGRLLCELLESRILLSYNSESGFSEEIDPLLVHLFNDYLGYLATSPGGTAEGYVPSVQGLKVTGNRVIVWADAVNSSEQLVEFVESGGNATAISDPGSPLVAIDILIDALSRLDRSPEVGYVSASAFTTNGSRGTEKVISTGDDILPVNVDDPFAEFWRGPLGKIGWELGKTFETYTSFIESGNKADDFRVNDELVTYDSSSQSVAFEGVVIDAKRLASDLEGLGVSFLDISGNLVSGFIPVSALGKLADLDSLGTVSSAPRITWAGAVTTQGDVAQKSDVARSAYSATGSGVSVGVLSDSFNRSGDGSYAADVTSADLPSGIQVLDDSNVGSDEGRAMLQIVHDVAPGAGLAFHTSGVSQSAFAQGIRDLRDAGANVIVDDVLFYEEPMFQDGTIAQAVDEVASQGISYFSAAGNQDSSSYENGWIAGATAVIGGVTYPSQNFSGGDVLQSITIPAGKTIIIELQWDQPFFNSSSDLNLYLFNSAVIAFLLRPHD